MAVMPEAAAMMDLVSRLEDLAHHAAWLMPEARTSEQAVFLDLVRLRSLEAGAMFADIAEQSVASDDVDDGDDLGRKYIPRGNGSSPSLARE